MTPGPFSRKRAVFGFARSTGLLALVRARHRRQALILTYHGVLPASDIIDPYLCRNVVESREFGRQMGFLASHFTALPLAELAERLAAGKPLPKHAVAVTFDDGFRNNVTEAYPILKRHGVPGTIFLTTSFIGQGTRMLWTERVAWVLRATPASEATLPLPDGPRHLDLASPSARERTARALLGLLKGLTAAARAEALDAFERHVPAPPGGPPPPRYAFLDWDEARRASGPDLEFGSHTVTHPILSTLSDEDSASEIADSKAAIEDHLGRPCRLFAYPNGTRADFSRREQDSLRRSGYSCAVSQIPGYNTAAVGRLELRRLNIGLGHVGPVFEAHASGLTLLLSGNTRA